MKYTRGMLYKNFLCLKELMTLPLRLLRKLQLAYLESLHVRRHIRTQNNYVITIKNLCKEPGITPELKDQIIENILPKEILILSDLTKLYETTILFTFPNTITYYILFLTFIREYLMYILFHFYLLLFIFSYFFSHIVISLTYCNYTGGQIESFVFVLLLSLMIISHVFTNDFGKTIFRAVAFLKGLIASSVFFKVCFGHPLLTSILSNHIFTISIKSTYTTNSCLSVLPCKPDFDTLLQILIEIPTIHYFS